MATKVSKHGALYLETRSRSTSSERTWAVILMFLTTVQEFFRHLLKLRSLSYSLTHTCDKAKQLAGCEVRGVSQLGA